MMGKLTDLTDIYTKSFDIRDWWKDDWFEESFSEIPEINIPNFLDFCWLFIFLNLSKNISYQPNWFLNTKIKPFSRRKIAVNGLNFKVSKVENRASKVQVLWVQWIFIFQANKKHHNTHKHKPIQNPFLRKSWEKFSSHCFPHKHQPSKDCVPRSRAQMKLLEFSIMSPASVSRGVAWRFFVLFPPSHLQFPIFPLLSTLVGFVCVLLFGLVHPTLLKKRGVARFSPSNVSSNGFFPGPKSSSCLFFAPWIVFWKAFTEREQKKSGWRKAKMQ